MTMTMTATRLERESEVARVFDGAEGRFAARIEPDDYRLVGLLDALGDVAGRRILDLGFGKGRFAAALRDRGARVVGLDVSLAMLSRASGFARIRGSATRLPIADATFDAVIAIETLQHVEAIDLALAEIRRVLRPGGRICVVDKNAHALNYDRPWLPNVLVKRIDERRGRGMYPVGSVVRERWFAPASFARRLRRAGFVDRESWGLLSPREAGRAIFRARGWARAMRLWTARTPGDLA